MKKRRCFCSFLLLAMVFAVPGWMSCAKEAGSGGTSEIRGRLKVIEYSDDFSQVRAEYYAQGEDVFLVYGDDEIYSDDFETSPEGYFSFKYLRKGKYRLYAYSADSSGNSPSGSVPQYAEVEVTKNNSVTDIGDLTILMTSRYNSGTSSISGRVYVRDYTPDFSVLLGQYYIYDEDVFLVHGDHQYYSDDLKTDVDGWYSFTRVPPGEYTVYAVSKDSTGTIPSGYYPVEKQVVITGNYQHMILDDIVILK